MLSIPQDVALILRLLRQVGHLAYVVGGCVRDALLGRTPKDWDICTSATPEEIDVYKRQGEWPWQHAAYPWCR